VDETMKRVVEKLKTEEGFKVLKETVVPAEKVKEMFSSFCEVEVKLTDLGKLNYLCLHYLPSSIEILDVENVTFTTREFTQYLNDLIAVVHQYNMLVANANAQNQMLKERLENPAA
ncbi:MAG: hypothetical protein WC595_05605, partial [Candidatus Nanoarchaeia archaeon]